MCAVLCFGRYKQRRQTSDDLENVFLAVSEPIIVHEGAYRCRFHAKLRCLRPILFLVVVAFVNFLFVDRQVLSSQDKRPSQAEITAAIEEADKAAGVFGKLF